MAEERHGGHFYDEAGTAAYLAHRHGGTASPNTVMEEPALLDHLGEVTGRRVLDLGCGDGSLAPTLLAMGVSSYVGIDASPAMVEVARREVGDPAATFEVGTIEDLDRTPCSLDLVVSRMALHYVADLEPVVRAVHAALAPGGRLVLTVVHPVITSNDDQRTGPRTSWLVDEYFVPGPRHRTWFGRQVTWHHRTVETYVRAVLDAGFSLDALSECAPSASLLAGDPDELARRRRVPLMLLLAATRG